MSSLKQALYEEYSGFADKRIKKLDSGTTFVVDDRSGADIGADRKLLSYFCSIFVDVRSETEVHVALRGNVPISKRVEDWAIVNNGDLKAVSLEFMVSPGQEGCLRTLAKAIRSIVAVGAPRYTIRSYKYVCPRTAASLDRLAEILSRTWSTS